MRGKCQRAVFFFYVGETSTLQIDKNVGPGGRSSCEQGMEKCHAGKEQSAVSVLG